MKTKLFYARFTRWIFAPFAAAYGFIQGKMQGKIQSGNGIRNDVFHVKTDAGNTRSIWLALWIMTVCLPCTLGMQAQNIEIAKHLRHYQAFSQSFAQEKVYLYFDNDNYFVGENIWFKAYVLMADNHHYSNMSKTLYVEMLSADGNLVDRLKLKIKDGQADGVFYIDPKLSAGFYEIRAYTRCMLNFDECIIFSRVLPVMDMPSYDKRSGERSEPTMKIKKPVLPDKRPETEKGKSDKETKAGNWQINFYPEGGHLVEGRPNHLAFKVSGKETEDFSAKILNSKNEVAAMLQAEHDGMGSAIWQVEKGEKYHCLVETKAGQKKVDLPAIQKDAYSMMVNNSQTDLLEIDLYTDQASRGDTLALIIACRGKIYQIQAFVNQAEALRFNFSKSALPTGVNEILVIDHQGKALTSRLVFIKNAQDQVQNIRFAQERNKETYRNFERAELTLALQQLRDSAWIALPEQCFAVSIRDNAEYMANAPQCDAFSQLLLASDLKGYIHNPSYYFEKDDRRHRRALDLLMMVQGWRRYDWNIMSQSGQFTLKHPIEKGILLDGQVLSIIRRLPMENLRVTMWMTGDSTANHGFCDTDEKGGFNFLFDFEGKQDLNLQVSDGKRRRNVFITINRQFTPGARVLLEEEMQAPVIRKRETVSKNKNVGKGETSYRELIIMPGDVLLDEVEVTAKKKGVNNDFGEVIISYEVQDEQDVLEDNAMYTYDDIPTFLTQINDHFHFRSSAENAETLYYKHAPVKFIHMPWRKVLMPDSSDMPVCSDIERIEIVEPGAIGHIVEDDFISGIGDVEKMGKDIAYVVLHEYKGKRHPQEEEMGIRRTTLQGYNTVKEFYHPRYDKVLDTDPSDHRRTLYWNPNVKTDKSGVAKIGFYHSATSRDFEVHGIVITPQGKIGWK